MGKKRDYGASEDSPDACFGAPGSTGKKLHVGTLFYPNLPGKTGFGNFKVQSDDFLEYFLGGTCDGAVTAQVGVQGTSAAHDC